MCSLTGLVQLHVLVSKIVKNGMLRSCETILKIVHHIKNYHKISFIILYVNSCDLALFLNRLDP